MVDAFIREIDDMYRRNVRPLPVPHKGVDSPEELRRRMISGIWKSSKMSMAQREHLVDNIQSRGVAQEIFSRSEAFSKPRVEGLAFERMGACRKDYEERGGENFEGYRRAESRRAGRLGEPDVLEKILKSFEGGGHRPTIADELAHLRDVKPATFNRDLTSLVKGGFLERIRRGHYRLTDLGKQELEKLR